MSTRRLPARVFVSSTFADLKDHRGAVREVIRKIGAEDIAMECLGARDERPASECLRLVEEESDLFVGIYAHRYGFVPAGSDTSITEQEYAAATASRVPRFVFLVDDNAPWVPAHIERGAGESKLAAFKARLKADHLCEFFTGADDLAKRVAASLGRHLSLGRLERVASAESPRTEAITGWPGLRDAEYRKSRGVFLVHSLAVSKEPGQLFDIRIYLLRHKSGELRDIRRADFFLGRFWDNEVYQVPNRGEAIGITVSAYGPFVCTCKVTFSDDAEVVLHRYVDFEAALGPR